MAYDTATDTWDLEAAPAIVDHYELFGVETALFANNNTIEDISLSGEEDPGLRPSIKLDPQREYFIELAHTGGTYEIFGLVATVTFEYIG